MLRINSLALTLAFLQANVHHAFIHNSRPHSFITSSKSGASTIRTFSTFLAEADRDVATFQGDDDESLDLLRAEFEDYSHSMDELTNLILSGGNVDTEILTTNSVISVLSYHSKQQTVEGAETIERILDMLEERSDQGEKLNYVLHCGHYTIAVTAWSKSGHPDSAEKATQIVERMKERQIVLNEVTYNTWMNAYAIQNNIAKVEEILQIMEEEIPEKIRVKDYNVLILANARQGRAKEAEQIVKSMVDRYSSGQSLVLPDLVTYTMLLDAWSKSGEQGRGMRAEAILDSIEQRHISFDSAEYSSAYTTEWTVSGTYVAAMRAVIHSGEDKIVERVEDIYNRLKERGITPDSYVYATLLDAYAIACPADASEKVQNIIEMMEENISDITLEDKTVVYNTALKLLKEIEGSDAITKAEELFQKMKSQGNVDEVTYGTVFSLYTNKGDSVSSAKRVEDLLDEMINEQGLAANTLHMNSAMNSLLRAGNIPKATEILDKMEEEYRNGNELMKPNVVSYTTLMNGWVKSDDPEKSTEAMKVFDKMNAMFKSGNKDAKPNFVSYVTLVDCIVKSGEAGAAERAEEAVKNMYESYSQGDLEFRPNTRMVSTVIDCWSKSGDFNAGERAEMLLNWLIEIYEEDRDPELMPGAHSFTSCKSNDR